MKLISTNSQVVQIPNTDWELLAYSLKGFKLRSPNARASLHPYSIASKCVLLTTMGVKRNNRENQKGKTKVLKTNLGVKN